MDDKFIKISNDSGLFYVQNIYSLIGIPNKATEFVKDLEIPKIKTKREKISVEY